MKHLCLLGLALFVQLANAQTGGDYGDPEPASAIKGIFKQKTDLPAGSLVILELNEDVFSNRVARGQNVLLRVRTDVRMQDKVLIATGCQAMGRVKRVQEAGLNNPASVTIELFYVQAVDGQQIALYGNEQTLPGQNPNEPGVAPVMSVFTAHTMNKAEVEVE